MNRHIIPGAAVGVLFRGHEHVQGFGVTDTCQRVPVSRDTLFRIGSTSKTFTGTAAMRLADSGLLNLDEEVTRYVPGFRAPAGAQNVTVRQLLNHSAGWLGDDFHDTGRGWDALPKYVERIAGLPQLTPAGSMFAYNNAAIALAGEVVARIAGITYEYAVRDLLLHPLGLRHTFYFCDEIVGHSIAAPHVVVNGRAAVVPRGWQLPRSINAAGGLMSTAADQLRYARFHLGDGRGPDGTRLLSDAALTAMRSHPGPGGTMIVAVLGMFTGLANLPAPQRRLSAAELEPYLGRYTLQQVDFAGRLVDEAPATMTARDSGLQLASGAGTRASRTLLTFYDSPFGRDYVLVKNSDGTPTGTRANFIRDQSGRVCWFRLSGRLHRHQA
jgi:CubicO group peptidase (beta-lactamase class C family)